MSSNTSIRAVVLTVCRGVNSRSNPATYTGIMDDVRKAFASANKVQASLFSFNSKGACESCQGLGVVFTELSFFDSVKSPCEICGGKRFKDEVLAYKLNGKSISDVLAMNVEQASNISNQGSASQTAGDE